MKQKLYKFAFGVNGTITPSIPDAADANGFVSYTEGFTFDYQRDLASDANAKEIMRYTINGLMYDVTLNLQDYQHYGSPEWITPANSNGIAFGYGSGAIVRYSASGNEPFVTYISLAQNNVDVPGATVAWQQLNQPFLTVANAATTYATVVALSAEALARQQVDQSLQNQINSEANARGTEDQNLQDQISARLSISGGSVTGNLTVNSSLTSVGEINALVGISANGLIVTSGMFSSQGGLRTSGDLFVGVTYSGNPVGDLAAGTIIEHNGAVNSYSTGWALGAPTGNAVITFYDQSGGGGNIQMNGGSVLFNTTSDRRLKGDIVPLTGATDRLKLVTAKRFHMLAKPDETIDGFIGDELSAAVPYAVYGQPDAIDSKGKPIYQMVDLSKLVPLLWASMQEMAARIETLEAAAKQA